MDLSVERYRMLREGMAAELAAQGELGCEWPSSEVRRARSVLERLDAHISDMESGVAVEPTDEEKALLARARDELAKLVGRAKP